MNTALHNHSAFYDEPPPRPITAMIEIADWALDYAAIGAADDEADLEAVERVRGFLHGTIANFDTPIPDETDFLVTAALGVAAVENLHGVVGLGDAVANAIGLVSAMHATATRRGPQLATHRYCAP
jgi:hypothetical protein